jgi:hypothetical protein
VATYGAASFLFHPIVHAMQVKGIPMMAFQSNLPILCGHLLETYDALSGIGIFTRFAPGDAVLVVANVVDAIQAKVWRIVAYQTYAADKSIAYRTPHFFTDIKFSCILG